jgi:hypothetical protein
MEIGSAGNVTINAPSSGAALNIPNAAANNWCQTMYGNTTTSQSYGLFIRAGTNGSDTSFQILNTSGAIRFNVSGAGALQLGAYGAGTLVTDASGNVTASSDIRLKNNIRDFTTGLDAIKQINPILHGYTEASGLDQNRTNYAGFSAQNIRDVIPEAIDEDEAGYLSLSDRPIIAALVNAIKEQQLIIDELKNRLTALEST